MLLSHRSKGPRIRTPRRGNTTATVSTHTEVGTRLVEALALSLASGDMDRTCMGSLASGGMGPSLVSEDTDRSLALEGMGLRLVWEALHPHLVHTEVGHCPVSQAWGPHPVQRSRMTLTAS